MYLELRTKRLLLRPLNWEDLPSIYEYAGNADNTLYMLNLPDSSEEDTGRFIREAMEEWEKDRPDNYEFVMVYGGKVIGGISLTLDDGGKEGELGWILNKEYWHRGFALEAALAVRDFALRTLEVERLIAHCDSRNHNSYRLMERLGLVLEHDQGIRYNKNSSEPSRELTYVLPEAK